MLHICKEKRVHFSINTYSPLPAQRCTCCKTRYFSYIKLYICILCKCIVCLECANNGGLSCIKCIPNI